MNMHGHQKGFTLIELVVVIVILGILAATALPKFISVQADAQLAAVQGVAGAVSSAFAINYGANLANTAKGAAVSGTATGMLAAINSVMAQPLPTGYTATGSISCTTGASAGSTNSIVISNTAAPAGSATATATLICTG